MLMDAESIGLMAWLDPGSSINDFWKRRSVRNPQWVSIIVVQVFYIRENGLSGQDQLIRVIGVRLRRHEGHIPTRQRTKRTVMIDIDIILIHEVQRTEKLVHEFQRIRLDIDLTLVNLESILNPDFNIRESIGFVTNPL